MFVCAEEKSIAEFLETDPEIQYADGDKFHGLEVIRCPGDTPGGHAFLSPSDATVVVGADLRNLPSGYLLPPPVIFTEDPGTVELALNRQLKADFDHVLTAHGSNVLNDGYERLQEFAYFPARLD